MGAEAGRGGGRDNHGHKLDAKPVAHLRALTLADNAYRLGDADAAIPRSL